MRLVIQTFIICLFVAIETESHAFQDPSANQNDLLFDYIDNVSETVGLETFESVSFEYIFAFTKQLGQIERFNLKPEGFMAWVQDAVGVRANFPYINGMSDDIFNEYVLPLRIRYESTARPEWRSFFKAELEPLVRGKSVNQAVELIFDHLMERIHLETEFSYDLGYRGDLDPLATYRGTYGDEVDVSILACAALRSVGIAARLAYTPHIRNAEGGKAWLEYLDETGEWNTWVPSMAETTPLAQHASALSNQLKGRAGIIFAHPAAPLEITETYIPVSPFSFKVSENEQSSEQYNLAFFSGNYLRPIRGMELMSIRTANPERRIGSSKFWTFKVRNDLAVTGELQ